MLRIDRYKYCPLCANIANSVLSVNENIGP